MAPTSFCNTWTLLYFPSRCLTWTFDHTVHFLIASLSRTRAGAIRFVHGCLPLIQMRETRGGTHVLSFLLFTLCPSKFSSIRMYHQGSYRRFLQHQTQSPLRWSRPTSRIQEPSSYTFIHIRPLLSDEPIEVELLGHEPDFPITLQRAMRKPSPISSVVFQYILGLQANDDDDGDDGDNNDVSLTLC